MRVEKLWGVVEILVVTVLIGLVALMTIACVAQVIWRYAFDNPLIWSEELARYTMIWIGYLSAWLAWKHRAHIALDAIQYLHLNWLTRASERLVEVLIFGYCAYTFFGNFNLLAITSQQPSAVLELPMSYVYAGYSAMTLLICGDVLFGWLKIWQQPVGAHQTKVHHS